VAEGDGANFLEMPSIQSLADCQLTVGEFPDQQDCIFAA